MNVSVWKLAVLVCLKTACLLALVSLFGAPGARAQSLPRFDLFAGYSYVRETPSTADTYGFNLHGGNAEFVVNGNRWVSAVADFGGYHASNVLGSGVDGTMSTYLFGPRLSFRRIPRVTPFAQILLGGAHLSGGSGLGFSSTNSSFALAAGGGLDLKLSRRFSFRPIEVNYLLTRFNEFGFGAQNQNNVRLSTGFVFHF
ncbi:MAG TPA: outer membrane beta-barrel protein [Dongiaceae bacterium]|nr:outer membrane beta-barrel protein [Dongiaceae bacterium]